MGTDSTLAIEIDGRIANCTFQPLSDVSLVELMKPENPDQDEVESDKTSPSVTEKDDFLEELLINMEAAKAATDDDVAGSPERSFVNSSASDWYFFREDNHDPIKPMPYDITSEPRNSQSNGMTHNRRQKRWSTTPINQTNKRSPLRNSGVLNQDTIPDPTGGTLTGKSPPDVQEADMPGGPNGESYLCGVSEENLVGTLPNAVECSECGYLSPSRGELRKHMRKHSSNQPFVCSVAGCSFRTRYPGNLKHHLPSHSGDRPFSCDKCDMSFKTKNNLVTHSLVHDVTKPFSCDTCGYRCKRRYELKMHKLSHSETRHFRCETCGHATKTKSDLQKHRTKHVVSRDFKCDQCDKAYKDGRALRKHIRLYHETQHPVQCYCCDKMFRNKVNLRNHVRLHEGHYPFLCEVCGMTFANNHNKRVHMNVHQGGRPYPCPLCPYAGKREIDVRAHIGVMHREEKLFRCGPCNIGFSKERLLIQHFNSLRHKRVAETWSNLCRVGKWLKSNPGNDLHTPGHPQPADSSTPAADDVLLDEVKLEPLEINPEEDLPIIAYDNGFYGSTDFKESSSTFSGGNALPAGLSQSASACSAHLGSTPLHFAMASSLESAETANDFDSVSSPELSQIGYGACMIDLGYSSTPPLL